jgi:hypothetical protein
LQAQAKAAAKAEVTIERVLKEYARIAFADIFVPLRSILWGVCIEVQSPPHQPRQHREPAEHHLRFGRRRSGPLLVCRGLCSPP